MSREYDVVVVGARVAGSTLAALLGDLGVRVLLVERVRFPRSTISTHFFRGAGLVAVLDRLGLLDEVLALGCPRITREWDFGLASPGPEEGPPQRAGDSDSGCRCAARRWTSCSWSGRAGARPSRWRSRQPSGRCCATATGSAASRWPRVAARSTSAAGSWSARTAATRPWPARCRRTMERSVEPLRTLYYRYVAEWRGPNGEPPDAAEFSLNGDEMAYVFPSDGGVTCIGLSAPAADFAGFRAAARRRARPAARGTPRTVVADRRDRRRRPHRGRPARGELGARARGPRLGTGRRRRLAPGSMDRRGHGQRRRLRGACGGRDRRLAGRRDERGRGDGALREPSAGSWWTPASTSARRSAATSRSSRPDPPARAAVLVTGMSATGKSTVLDELDRRGSPGGRHRRGGWIDASARRAAVAGGPDGGAARRPRPVPAVRRRLRRQPGRVLPPLRRVVLLSAPQEVLVERLATRTTNAFGKRTASVQRILADLHDDRAAAAQGRDRRDRHAPTARAMSCAASRTSRPAAGGLIRSLCHDHVIDQSGRCAGLPVSVP